MITLNLFFTLITLGIGYMISVLANRKTSFKTALAYIFCAAVLVNAVEVKLTSSNSDLLEIYKTTGLYIATPYDYLIEKDEKKIVEYALIQIELNEDKELLISGLSFYSDGKLCGKFKSTKASFDHLTRKIYYSFVGAEGQNDFEEDNQGEGFYSFESITNSGINVGHGEFKNPISKVTRKTEFHRIYSNGKDPETVKGAQEIISTNMGLNWHNNNLSTYEIPKKTEKVLLSNKTYESFVLESKEPKNSELKKTESRLDSFILNPQEIAPNFDDLKKETKK